MNRLACLMITAALACGVALGFALPASAEPPVLLKAMQDELQRSVDKLRLEGEAKPYFVSYLVRDGRTLSIAADSGAITTDDENHARRLKVDVRVGDYVLDNSHFENLEGMMMRFESGGGDLAVADDYDVLRRQLWLETDRAYKEALETFTKKKSYLDHAIRSETLDDFTKADAVSEMKASAPWDVNRPELVRTVENLSKLFLQNDKIQKSHISLETDLVNVYYVNSEGSASIEQQAASRLAITAVAQADDGMPLKNFRLYTFDNPKTMPSEAKIRADVAAMVEELMALRSAPVADDHSGPVLFEGQAAAELLAQGFVSNLAAKRTSESDNAQFNMFSGKRENPFLSKVGTSVIAKTVSVKATPTAKALDGVALLGAYDVDDEGVKARDASLVENGLLKAFMMSRSPVKGFNQSNGHSREGAAAPSVVQFTTSAAAPAATLKDKLIEEVKSEGLPYGILVRSVIPPAEAAGGDDVDIESLIMAQMNSSPDQVKLSKPVLVYRVYPDGREELVRGAEFSGVSLKSFKDIVAMGDDRFVYNYPINSSDLPFDMSFFGGATDITRFATVVTPSFIVSEQDVNKSSGVYRKPPIVSYPARTAAK